MISPATIQQIQSRIDIVDVVGNFVRLRKRGGNYLGLCPFHNEKTPSFTVSPTKEIYKCFGCGKSGNSISFIMEHEKYSYVEALKWLAHRYNIEIEETDVNPEQKQRLLLHESLFAINNFAKNYFSDQLFNTEEGNDVALSYLKHRGFREEIIKKFNIGFNPSENSAFANAAIKAQYSKENLVSAGLIAERNGKIYDSYRGRIIFPIHNQSGKILGFGARLIGKNDKAPKYINTPENEIYVKGKILYGIYFARQAIDKADECLLVEGYTDVISLHQSGIENVVASGGTALTPDQLRLIKKFTNNLTIIYDGDSAGIKAALRGLDLALEEGLDVKLLLIPDNEDPDSYVNKVGAAKFSDFIKENKKDFVLFQLEVMLQEAGNDISKKSAVVNHIAATLAKLNKVEDFIKRQDYVRKISQTLNIEEEGLNDLVNKLLREKVNKVLPPVGEKLFSGEPSAVPEVEEEVAISESDKFEFAVLRALIEFGLKEWEGETVADHIFKEIEDNELEFGNENNLKVYNLYREWYLNGSKPDASGFLYYDDREISSHVVQILDLQVEISPNWKDHYDGKIFTREDLYKEEVRYALIYLKLRKVKSLIRVNQQEMQKAETEEQIIILKTHQLLKVLEIELTAELGGVIFK
ncbi:MAG: DNA primase [Bacteroidetes bacterium]|nr:DNA primase [Bacteroidota bacterium]